MYHVVPVNRPEKHAADTFEWDKVGIRWHGWRWGKQATHVVFRRVAPLLHVHDFHVQHSPKLHLDPAKAMHKSVRRAAAAAPDKLSSITGGKSQHSSLCHLTIQLSIKRSARSRPIFAARACLRWRNDHQSDLKLINSPFKPALLALGETHTAEDPGRERFSRCLQPLRLASGGRSADEVGHLKNRKKKKVRRVPLCLPRCLQKWASACLEIHRD